MYRLLDWKSLFTHMAAALDGADRASEAFLSRGIARWETEKRLDSSEAASLRTRLSSGEVQEAMHHMGAHLVLSLAIAVPIPGLRSLTRLLWTLTFWVKFQFGRFRASPEGSAKRTNIHTPLVMVLALLPALGGVAYMAARPLRTRPLVRLMFDQAAFGLPFGLYGRLRLARWLALPPKAETGTVAARSSFAH